MQIARLDINYAYSAGVSFGGECATSRWMDGRCTRALPRWLGRPDRTALMLWDAAAARVPRSRIQIDGASLANGRRVPTCRTVAADKNKYWLRELRFMRVQIRPSSCRFRRDMYIAFARAATAFSLLRNGDAVLYAALIVLMYARGANYMAAEVR